MSNIEIKQLSEKQYLQTMSSGMKNITKVAESLVDIWNYAEYLLQNNLLSEYGFQMRLIEAVYVNSENTYQHILLSTYQKNLYVVPNHLTEQWGADFLRLYPNANVLT